MMTCQSATKTGRRAWASLQVGLDFIEKHADRKVTKKWVHAKVKEIAERDNGKWSVNAQALADAGKQGHADVLLPCISCLW